jgi:hypothetical protein
MNKATLFFLLILPFCQFNYAQITITDADMPSVNDIIIYSLTNDIQGQDPVLTGANYTWDYSLLQSTSQRLDTFETVSSTPLAYQFYFNNGFLYSTWEASYAMKGIDIGVPQVPITDVYNFFKNSSAEYSNVGFGSNINGVPSSTRNIPVDVEYVFPLNYGNTNVSNSEFGISVPTFGFYGQSLERTDTVDGWGELTTPYGTFDCLRVKSVLSKIDTTYIDFVSFGTTVTRPEEIEYKWLANGMSTPVLKIVTTGGNITTIEYQDNLSTVGVAELEQIKSINFFPNPTKDYLSITFNSLKSSSIDVEIKDINGKMIGTESYAVAEGDNLMLINLLKYNLTKGMYFIETTIDSKKYSTKILFTE